MVTHDHTQTHATRRVKITVYSYAVDYEGDQHTQVFATEQERDDACRSSIAGFIDDGSLSDDLMRVMPIKELFAYADQNGYLENIYFDWDEHPLEIDVKIGPESE